MDSLSKLPTSNSGHTRFMSLVATTRKLGISFFAYVRDRISQLGNIPSLHTIIRDLSSLNSFGYLWNPE